MSLRPDIPEGVIVVGDLRWRQCEMERWAALYNDCVPRQRFSRRGDQIPLGGFGFRARYWDTVTQVL